MKGFEKAVRVLDYQIVLDKSFGIEMVLYDWRKGVRHVLHDKVEESELF